MISDNSGDAEKAGRAEGRLEAKRRWSQKTVTWALALTVVGATVATPLAIKNATGDLSTASSAPERTGLGASVPDEVLLEGEESLGYAPRPSLARGEAESIGSHSLKGEELQAETPAAGGDHEPSGSEGDEELAGGSEVASESEAPKNPCSADNEAPESGLAAAPDPLLLKPGVLSGSFIIYNCGSESTGWTAQSKPSVSLSQSSGQLGAGMDHRLAFTIDKTKFPPGDLAFKIKVSRPGQNIYVDVKGAIAGLAPSNGGGGGGPAPAKKITTGGTGGGCATQCITKAWLTPNAGNPNLALEVKTHTPAKLVVYVSTNAPAHSPSGDPYFPAARPKASSGESLKTVWTANLKHLQADTRYHIIVKAVDAQGGVSYREGAFKTLKPAVDPDMGLADKGGPSGCATQCIKTAKLIAADKSANLDVRTVTSAQMRVKVSTKPPKQGSNGPLFLSFDAWADSGYEYRESWETTLEPLKENTLYHIGLWATDEKGRTSYQQGKFRTRKSVPPIHVHNNRPVLVTFHKIHVTNDADNSAGQPGKGELSFDFFVEGEHRPEMHQERRDIKSGQTVNVTADGTTRPGVSALLQQAPHVLDLRVFAEEQDTNIGKGGCHREAGKERFPQGSGRDSCWEWNNAQVSIDFEEAFKSGALPGCYGFGVSGDACLFVRTTHADPAFSVLVSLEFLK